MERSKRKKTTSCGTLTVRKCEQSGIPEVLLIKQFAHKDTWGVPKGRLDHAGESFEDCALRETFEETGVRVVLDRLLHPLRIKLRNETKTVIIWTARELIPGSVPMAKHDACEVADAAWFKITELPPITEYQRSLITQTIKPYVESLFLNVFAEKKSDG